MRTTSLLTLAIGLAVTAPAIAAPATPSDTAWPWTPPDPDAYRLEVAAVDASAVAVLALGYKSTVADGLAVATFALGSPILHLVHHRPGSALGSLLLRTGLPIVGGAVGWALTSGGPDDKDLPPGAAGLIVGLGAGALVASAFDIGVLARHLDEAPRLAPAVAPTSQGGMTFGLAGRF